MTTEQSRKANELVINWHMTEVCNYSCKYCFAKWGRPKELHRSEQAIANLLDKLADYFIKGTPVLKEKLGYESVRLNFAGGEPMMLGNTFVTALVLAKQKGFKTSIITNGHYLIHGKSPLPKDTLDMIGISFDSQYLSTRMKIGRNDRKGNSFGVNDLTHALANLTQSQTGIKTKINTVINSLNWEEDFSNLISSLKPYKWKVLQVMPYGDNEMLISKEQFDNFVLRHSGLGLPMYSESNSTMTESYLMISPEGCFYQNTANKPGYKYSECINSCGVEKALSQIEFNPITFASRYKETNIDIIELS
ncbi:viperin family antiviral radical SAM protein [Vibrio vulnificus]|jgi:radical S-adenosyl methionine domain-containing protein 2|uniref:viperin family antiviral radical SAM protein n=1 Tax=Vibrio TaxID=662 RepID=UPI00046F300F|nr:MULTISPECIES: viperin family antiviral radical SAM protein [Vibrio]EKO3444917.1 4Fe-4S cluster-binding domain-containing protein [Vibrio fluvialis]HAS3380721.1 4Fe-4S cluster-binding domain-containing protein [Vibrio cholerae]EJG0619918.1 4Fe-4S cluster-binding domain-containing protein [Vibrio parahaemolyticus]EJG0622874.1 4Fe-4S cluster-binding domain-containing protein [Vibrio parahaemolyticus]EJG0638116.1 4Fe-4S cluster-binding domain-containing protein [Vibrio parahaemolyticus]